MEKKHYIIEILLTPKQAEYFKEIAEEMGYTILLWETLD